MHYAMTFQLRIKIIFIAKFVIVVLEISSFPVYSGMRKKGPCSSDRMVIGNTVYLLHVHFCIIIN